MSARGVIRILAGLCAAVLLTAAASDPAERLPDPAQEARARGLFTEVRCLVCQNESIDDSSAELAQDLRKVVREQVVAGRTDQQIREFLVDRYGEFVLLKPSFSMANLALWLAPLLVGLIGVGLLIARLRARPADAPLSAEEESRLVKLAAEDAD
jgi:cytochrome c-type biogenesis protein CcmH